MEAEETAQPTPTPHKRQRYQCPVCHRLIVLSGQEAGKRLKFFPFCSERCKLIDLGAWLDGDYRIPARPDDPSEEPAADDTTS